MPASPHLQHNGHRPSASPPRPPPEHPRCTVETQAAELTDTARSQGRSPLSAARLLEDPPPARQ
eukprot:15287876-Alexandrium_andersonii.AAC.1